MQGSPPGRGSRIVYLLVVLPFVALGCGGAASAGDDGAPTIVPDTEELFRIGSVAGGSWEAFSRLTAAGFDDRGNLYLLDGGDRKLTMVDSNGAFVRMVGRAGDGPGEFRSPQGMAVFPDGRVVVSDVGHRGFLLFDADGGFAGTIPFGEAGMAPTILLRHGDDSVVFPRRAMMMGMGSAAQGPSDVPIFRATIQGDTPPAEFHRAWIPPREPPRVSNTGSGTMIVRAPPRAFEPQLHMAVLPDGTLAVADSATYRIHLVGPDGAIEQTLDRPIAPVPVTDREREREKARQLEELQSDGGATGSVMAGMGGGGPPAMDPSQMRAMREAQLENLGFWPEIPVIHGLAADREGRLWVRRFGGVGAPGPIDILGRDGRLWATIPAGTVDIPAAFGPGGVAAWIERDELDVPFVRVARLAGLP